MKEKNFTGEELDEIYVALKQRLETVKKLAEYGGEYYPKCVKRIEKILSDNGKRN
jgi:hypothetical protein